MKGLERRLERLERETRPKFERQIIYLMPNLKLEEPDETPYSAKITSKLWPTP